MALRQAEMTEQGSRLHCKNAGHSSIKARAPCAPFRLRSGVWIWSADTWAARWTDEQALNVNGLTGLFRRRLIAVLAAQDRKGAAVIRLLSVVFRIGGSELLERAAREREPRDDGRAEGCGVARSFDQVARGAVGTCYRIC